ncbi:hypothetical protein J6590_080700, partial [Homalodisca vitripennis]
AAISNHQQVESPTDGFSFREESPSAIASNFHNFQAVTKSADVPNLQLMCPPCKWKLLHRVIILAAHDRAIHTQVTWRLLKSRHVKLRGALAAKENFNFLETHLPATGKVNRRTSN